MEISEQTIESFARHAAELVTIAYRLGFIDGQRAARETAVVDHPLPAPEIEDDGFTDAMR